MHKKFLFSIRSEFFFMMLEKYRSRIVLFFKYVQIYLLSIQSYDLTKFFSLWFNNKNETLFYTCFTVNE